MSVNCPADGDQGLRLAAWTADCRVSHRFALRAQMRFCEVDEYQLAHAITLAWIIIKHRAYSLKLWAKQSGFCCTRRVSTPDAHVLTRDA